MDSMNAKIIMFRRFFIYFLVFTLASTSGCTLFLIGGAATAGAIAVSQDFATTSLDVSFERAWKVSLAQLRKVGRVHDSLRKMGEIDATVEDSKVHVKISRLNEHTVDIKVSARKNLLPNTDLAQSILASIIRRLK